MIFAGRPALLCVLCAAVANASYADGRREVAAVEVDSVPVGAGDPNAPALTPAHLEQLYDACKLSIGSQLPDQCDATTIMQMSEALPRPLFVQGFRISTTEVSVGDYRQCVVQGRCDAAPLIYGPPRRDDEPVADITWGEASRYCAVQGGHLPTLFQWQKALGDRDASGANLGLPMTTASRWAAQRGGLDWDYAVGRPDPTDGYALAAPVRAMPWTFAAAGPLHLLGNVAEWTRTVTLSASATANNELIDPGTLPPLGQLTSGYRVVGGSWRQSPLLAAARAVDWLGTLYGRDARYAHIGFRCVWP